LIEKAAHLWGKAGQRSVARSALKEATAQLARALTLIAALPSTASLRSVQIELQLALANALMHVKGYAASETKASLDQARMFIERMEALGESPEDPLALFAVLYGFWVANHGAFNGDAVCELAAQFLALGERQKATVPLYGAKSVTDTRSELGIRTDKSYAMQDAILTLRSRFAWAHDFNPDRSIAATFQTSPGTSFVVNGAAQASDSALTAASAELKWTNGWSVAETFEGEFSDVTRSYAGKGVVRYAW
jgi:hypothetical protein